MRLWIDTDVGSDVDDALTLAWAMRHPEVELVGVSTVFGDVALRTRIARALLGLGGHGAVPVVEGLGAPLTPGRPGRMFGHEGIGLFDDAAPVPITERDVDVDGRVEALASQLAAARPDALLAIGPMTNVGALARAGYALPALTIMGGKTRDVELPGTLPQIPEWNWWCDPHAVNATLEAPAAAPPRIVPIEVTIRTVLPESTWSQLGEGDALARALERLCRAWIEALRTRLHSKRPDVHLHDPLAAMTLVDASVCPFEPATIRLDDDAVTQHDEAGAAVEVARDVDLERLRSHLMETWLRRDRP